MQYDDVVAKMWDVVVVGAGPGGLGAALYTARAELSTLVIDKQFVGGLIALTHEVENYPAIERASGMELAQLMEAQVRKFGAEFIFKDVLRVDPLADEPGFSLSLGDGRQLKAWSVVIASGSAPRRIPAAGEREYYGRGVSYCATCDAAFFRNKEIAVVGGGESAFQEGLFLTHFGSKVTLIHRRPGFRATELAIKRARAKPNWAEKIGYTIEEIVGEAQVTGLRLRNVHTGEMEEFPVDGVFGFIGYEPASAFAKHLIATDEEGYIITDRNLRTSVSGIWAAGDIVQGAKKQMVISAGNGATAAMDIREYLAEHKES
jgi:thioredoxin reductase (NADPH)